MLQESCELEDEELELEELDEQVRQLFILLGEATWVDLDQGVYINGSDKDGLVFLGMVAKADCTTS